jgi:hypothetical protein
MTQMGDPELTRACNCTASPSAALRRGDAHGHGAAVKRRENATGQLAEEAVEVLDVVDL